jgi:hypothetical protein
MVMAKVLKTMVARDGVADASLFRDSTSVIAIIINSLPLITPRYFVREMFANQN